MTHAKTYITTAGYGELQQKINNLEQKMKDLLLEKAVAYEASGDGWHDNPGWIQIGQQEERLTLEIKELKDRLKTATLVESDNRNTNTIQIGSIVQISQNVMKHKREMVLEIVGSQESNLSKGRIAYDTPIGKAILGFSEGDEVDFLAPAGKMKIKILKLFANWDETKNH